MVSSSSPLPSGCLQGFYRPTHFVPLSQVRMLAQYQNTEFRGQLINSMLYLDFVRETTFPTPAPIVCEWNKGWWAEETARRRLGEEPREFEGISEEQFTELLMGSCAEFIDKVKKFESPKWN